MNTAGLAALFGISVQSVRTLARTGVIARTGKLFGVAECMRRYASHLRDAAAGRGKASGGEAAVSARARLADLQADAQDMKNKLARGELIPVDVVKSEWSQIVLATRTAVLNAVPRMANEHPHLSRSDIQAFDRANRAALEGLTKAEW